MMLSIKKFISSIGVSFIDVKLTLLAIANPIVSLTSSSVVAFPFLGSLSFFQAT